MKKFRVWDKRNNAYTDQSCIKFFIGQNGHLYEFYQDYGGSFWDDKKTEEIHGDNFVVQFSTGLFDKNGCEVFEGDIIQYEMDDSRLDSRLEVGLCKVMHPDEDANSDCYSYNINQILKFEVVGNIFENPA